MGTKHHFDSKVLTTFSSPTRPCKNVFLNKLESQNLLVADFTDGASTSGYLDIDVDLPANAVVVGWKSIVSGAFAGDTTAVISVGIAGDTDKYSGVTTASCFATGTVGAMGNTDSAMATTAQTVRVTVTGGADFTSIVTDAGGAMIVSLYYFIAW